MWIWTLCELFKFHPITRSPTRDIWLASTQWYEKHARTFLPTSRSVNTTFLHQSQPEPHALQESPILCTFSQFASYVGFVWNWIASPLIHGGRKWSEEWSRFESHPCKYSFQWTVSCYWECTIDQFSILSIDNSFGLHVIRQSLLFACAQNFGKCTVNWHSAWQSHFASMFPCSVETLCVLVPLVGTSSNPGCLEACERWSR